jgi:hypothetical protein
MPFAVDFSSADWAKVHLTYNGDKFHSSLTPSAMQGLVHLQASLYRSAAEILKGSANARHLTNLERSGLELTFVIREGSAETEGDGKGFLSSLAGAISTMDSKHKLIAVLVLGLSYFTVEGANLYLQESGKYESQVIEAERSKELMQHDAEQSKLLADAFKSSSMAAEVHEQSSAGFDAVVRHSGDVSSLNLQGIPLDRESIDKLRSTTRRVAHAVTYDEAFRIKTVDPSSADGYEIEIESVASGKIFKAVLYDSLASDKMRRTIQRAEWERKPVRLTVTARALGEDVVDARIAKAILPKPKPLSIPPSVIRSRRV